MLKVSKILTAGIIKGADGKPLKLYHGSQSVFDKFEDLSYFTDDPNEANGYATAGEKLRFAIGMSRKYKFVKPEGLKIPDSFSYDECCPIIEDYEGPDNTIYGVEDGLAYRIKGRYFILENRKLKYVQADWKAYPTPGTSELELYYRKEIKDAEDEAAKESPSVYPVYLSMNKPYVTHDALWGNMFAKRWENGNTPQTVSNAAKELSKLKAEGYDGIIVPSDAAMMARALGEGPEHDVTNYVVFSSSQVHSVFQPPKDF